MKRDSRSARVVLLGLLLARCDLGSQPIVPPEELDGAVSDQPAVPDTATPDGAITDSAIVDASPDNDSAITDASLDRGSSVDTGVADASIDRGSSTDTGVADASIDRGSSTDTGVADVPVDRGSSTDTGVADTGVALPDTSVMVPPFDAATIAHIREVRTRGAAMGMRLTVFAKIGDSITESASFLSDIGFGWYSLGRWSGLEATIRYFSTTPAAVAGGEANSFNRASTCAMGGWIAQYALANDPDSALRRELSLTRPAWALVMYGTNDVDYYDVATFRTNMNRIVDIIEANGTVAALSTIPDRLDRPTSAALVPTFNNAIRDIAATRHLPLMDYWSSMAPLPNRGIDTDGIHPSPYRTAGGGIACGELTDAGLRYGYNMRNLVAIAMLDRLRAIP